jgi:hypothetical protein
MGAKEILAYRDRAVMSAKQFIELWLEEYPSDQPYHVALILAELLETERGCVNIPNKNSKFDYLNDDVAAARNELKRTALAGLSRMADERGGIDAIPTVSLNRDGLVKALAKLRISGPRFLYPPTSGEVAEQPDRNGGSAAQVTAARGGEDVALAYSHTAHPRAAELASGLCSHSEDFRTAVWYGEKLDFAGRQAKAIEALWAEWEKGDLGLSQQTIAFVIDSASERFQLRDIFRRHRAWGRMIHPAGGKGIFRLGPPPA